MPPYSQARVRSLLKKVDGAKATADAKGAALEDLVRYLFELIPKVELSDRNVLDAPKAHEIDLAFWNDQRFSDLHFLDAILIVECKATADPVGSNDVGWFARKLQQHGAHDAILVALNGITGDGSTSAHSEILTALSADKIKILVLTREEILQLKSTSDLAQLLKRKYTKLTLKRAVQAPKPKTADKKRRKRQHSKRKAH